jgi:hypothetical protein
VRTEKKRKRRLWTSSPLTGLLRQTKKHHGASEASAGPVARPSNTYTVYPPSVSGTSAPTGTLSTPPRGATTRLELTGAVKETFSWRVDLVRELSTRR